MPRHVVVYFNMNISTCYGGNNKLEMDVSDFPEVMIQLSAHD